MGNPFGNFAPTNDPRVQGQTPVQTAMPMPQQAGPMPSPGPILGMPQQPTNIIDTIMQALSQAGPKFMAQAQSMLDTRLPQIDQSIQGMQAKNAALRDKLQMPLGVVPQAPPAQPIAPLDLFGPPTEMPKAPSGPPSPQDFMQRHNAKTPTKAPQTQVPQASMAPGQAQMPDPSMGQPFAQGPMEQTTGPVPIPPVNPAVAGQPQKPSLGEIAAALGPRVGAMGGEPLKTNWLTPRPRVGMKR